MNLFRIALANLHFSATPEDSIALDVRAIAAGLVSDASQKRRWAYDASAKRR